MAQLEPRKNEIGQAGVELVCIAAEKSTGVWKPAKFLQSHPVSYPFLLDEDRSVTKAYGLYHRIALDALNIAHPATIVIDRDRKVAYIYRGDSQTDLSPFDQALEAAKKLSVLVERHEAGSNILLEIQLARN
jgi:peroxiredoxin